MLKMVVQQGRRRNKTGGVSLRYVEDFGESRTKLAAINIKRFLANHHRH
jgi:hypothetical protein